MRNIDEAKQELYEFIDKLEITYDLYDILVDLYKNYDDRLFVKIMEEVKDGNISFYDFKRIFNSDNDFLKESLENQEKLYREHKLMRERLIALDEELARAHGENSILKRKSDFKYLDNNDFKKLMSTYEHYNYVAAGAVTQEEFESGLTKYYTRSGEAGSYTYILATEYSNSATYYRAEMDYSAAGIEKENVLLYNLTQQTDDPMTELYRTRMLKDLLSSDAERRNKYIDSMLLSVHDYIVPVDYSKILLNNGDRKFARENGLTEEEMKKMKSFAAYLSTFYQE